MALKAKLPGKIKGFLDWKLKKTFNPGLWISSIGTIQNWLGLLGWVNNNLTQKKD